MRASVKEVQKLSADAKKAMGSASGPSHGAAGKGSMSSRKGAWARSAAGGDRSFSPGFANPAANVPREQLGNKKEIVCFKCQKKGHSARDYPNKYGSCKSTGRGPTRHNPKDC